MFHTASQAAGPFAQAQAAGPFASSSSTPASSHPQRQSSTNDLNTILREWKAIRELPADAKTLYQQHAIERLQKVELGYSIWLKQHPSHPALKQFDSDILLTNMQALKQQYVQIIDAAHNAQTLPTDTGHSHAQHQHSHSESNGNGKKGWLQKLFNNNSNRSKSPPVQDRQIQPAASNNHNHHQLSQSKSSNSVATTPMPTPSGESGGASIASTTHNSSGSHSSNNSSSGSSLASSTKHSNSSGNILSSIVSSLTPKSMKDTLANRDGQLETVADYMSGSPPPTPSNPAPRRLPTHQSSTATSQQQQSTMPPSSSHPSLTQLAGSTRPPPSGTFTCICNNSPENRAAVITTAVSRYKKVRTLRETLFGKVRLCIDTVTNERVALKLSKKELLRKHVTSAGKEVAENPLAELDFLRRLAQGPYRHSPACPLNSVSTIAQRALTSQPFSSPFEIGSRYVLKLVGQCEDNEFYYSALEFCSEGEFFDILIKAQRFKDATAAQYFKHLLLGVAYMHACGICHLDLSLENCLLNDKNDLKICDFGVSRLIPYTADKSAVKANDTTAGDREDDEHAALPHAVEVPYPGSSKNKPGKLGYMAPEVFQGNTFYGTKADIWSMGVILFIMLLGVPPFQLPATSDQRFNLIYKGETYKLLQAWKLHNTVAPEAVDLLNRMMAPPEKRITISQIFQHPWVTKRS